MVYCYESFSGARDFLAHKKRRRKMNKVVMSKSAKCGYVEIQEGPHGGWHQILVNGVIKEQSADWSYIKDKYDRYYV
jgi:hypothetical protein